MTTSLPSSPEPQRRTRFAVAENGVPMTVEAFAMALDWHLKGWGRKEKAGGFSLLTTKGAKDTKIWCYWERYSVSGFEL